MKIFNISYKFSLLYGSLAFVLISCGDSSHMIKMKGSDTEVNLAVNLAEQFYDRNHDFSIAISGGGSGLGITSLLNGQADIANSSRPLSDDEKELFKKKNIELKTVIFAEDATAFVVNSNNPLNEVTVAQLADLLSGKTNNWNMVSGENMPVNIYGRQSSSGTYSFIKKKLKIDYSPEAKEMTGNAQILEGIKVDKSGIGYVGAGYISKNGNQNQGIKVLKVKEDEQAEAVSPLDQKAIQQRRYYFQRPLYQFIPTASWTKVEPFIQYETKGAGRKIIKNSGYYLID